MKRVRGKTVRPVAEGAADIVVAVVVEEAVAAMVVAVAVVVAATVGVAAAVVTVAAEIAATGKTAGGSFRSTKFSGAVRFLRAALYFCPGFRS